MMPVSNPVPGVEFVSALLVEARDKVTRMFTEMLRENRKLVDQLADARDGIAERDARIKELEEELARRAA